VAASRAKNQLWIVHSLNPDTDLKPGDLRLRLIKHAEDPQASRRQKETGEKRAESEFERLVLSDLTSAGYRVVCQWEVGAYSIDLVALGEDGKKVAIECDGDRFHPQEKLGADTARQMVLERLGWRFVRIRGTEYFRNRPATIQRVVRRFGELGISPIGAKTEAQPMPDPTNDLRSRVIRKAQEIRDRWKNNPIDSSEDLDGSSIGRSWFKRKRFS
jgi:very-short-patch-repair endonuclease